MTRNMKSLVLALLALAVAGAASASVASAEATIFRTNNPGQTILFSGQHENAVFATDFLEFVCSTQSYWDTTVGEVHETFQLTPSYSACKSGSITLTVKMNGCDFFFVAGAFDEKSNTEGWINIVCPGAGQITAEVFLGMTKTCTITVPAQNNLKKVTYTNKADIEGNFTLLADVGVEGFAYTQDPGTGIFKCPAKNAKDGAFFTQFTIRGNNPETNTPVDIWIE